MSAYQAARAAEILGRESLPERLTVEEIATLQVHDERPPEPWLRDDGKLSVVSRFVHRSIVGGIWCKAMQAAIDAGELRQADGKITASDFKRWLDVQGDSPSMLIEGWFSLHAREQKAPGGGKKWTDEELAELRAFRDEHGTKATAQKFGISEARVRQLLPAEKPAANWLVPEKRTKRGRKT